MRKKLFFINGNSGIGKSTTARALMKVLPNCALLDYDWCCCMSPKIYNDETRFLKNDNSCYIINNYLHQPLVENIIFCGTFYLQKRIDQVMSQLDLSDVDVFNIILTANEKVFKRRFNRDIKRGKRQQYFIALKDGEQVCEKSIDYRMENAPLFEQLNGIKIDTSHLTVPQVVQAIQQIAAAK